MEDVAVRIAIDKARKGIGQYLSLMRSLHEVDVSSDRDFQRRYNSFYRVRQRSAEWYSTYYTVLESHKRSGAEFDQVLNWLWERLGRYEPSFSSKLVATIDPNMPIWDRFVLDNTGLRAPYYTDPQRLVKAKQVYRQICGWYANKLSSMEGCRIIEIFDREVPAHREITDLKKLDFVLWQTRD